MAELDVVDAHDFAAVHVDDLLVEEIEYEIQRLFVWRRSDLRSCVQRDRAIRIDVHYGIHRREARPLRGFDHKSINLREDFVGAVDEKIGDPPDRQFIHCCAAADEL